MTAIDHSRYKQKKALNSSITAIQGSIKDGAEGESRTRTTVGHYPLKIACLPIPPLRHLNFYDYFVSVVLLPDVGVASALFAAGIGIVTGLLSASAAGTVAACCTGTSPMTVPVVRFADK